MYLRPLINLREDGDFGEIVLRLAGRDKLAEVEGFTLGGEFALAGSPVAGPAPVFLGVECKKQYDECGQEDGEPAEGLTEEALHPKTSVRR